jgi:hypothetical protein
MLIDFAFGCDRVLATLGKGLRRGFAIEASDSAERLLEGVLARSEVASGRGLLVRIDGLALEGIELFNVLGGPLEEIDGVDWNRFY